MPSIRKTIALLQGASNSNILTGERYEFARGPQLWRFYAAQDGAVDGTVKLTTFAGNVVNDDAIDVPTAAAAGQGPNTSDHYIGQMIVTPGDRVQVKLENTDGTNPSNVRVLAQISQ